MPLHQKNIICIGTSTGGPRALETVLKGFPKEINAIIVIVQHMPPKFTSSLANRLDSICDIHVKEAEDKEVLKKGIAYIAPGGFHLKIEQKLHQLQVHLLDSEPVNRHRPSVDVLFQSISEIKGYQKFAVILTGMGFDGKQGLLALKNSGNTLAIAESEESAIVYGMPKSAISTGMVDHVLKVDKIAPTILDYINS